MSLAYLVQLFEEETLARSGCPREEDRFSVEYEVYHVPLLLAQPL